MKTRRRRMIVGALAFLLMACVGLGFGTAWLLGLVPLFPSARNIQVCKPPTFYYFGTSASWHLWTSICFNTTASDDTVRVWYEQLGWEADNPKTRTHLGLPIVAEAQIGEVHLQAAHSVVSLNGWVNVASYYEFFSPTCTRLFRPGEWSLLEIGDLLTAFVQACAKGLSE